MITDGNPVHRAERLTSDPAFDIGGGDFTMQTWVNFSTTAGEQVLLEKFTGPAGPGWTLYKNASNGVELYLDAAVGSDLTISSPTQSIPTGVWHQFAASRSGNTFTLYFDGAPVQTASSSLIVSSSVNGFLVGARHNGSGPGVYGVPSSGLIDEVAFWNSALSASDINGLFNGGQGFEIIPEPSTAMLLAVGGLFLRRRLKK